MIKDKEKSFGPIKNWLLGEILVEAREVVSPITEQIGLKYFYSRVSHTADLLPINIFIVIFGSVAKGWCGTSKMFLGKSFYSLGNLVKLDCLKVQLIIQLF